MKRNTKVANEKAASHLIVLLRKAESTEKLLEAARSQWRSLKLEHKHARKAFKQAKKAARYARKEAKAAARDLKRKGIKLPRVLKPATLPKSLPGRKGKRATPHAAARRNGNGHSATTLQPAPAMNPPVSVQLGA